VDDRDRAILDRLRKDGRTPNATIGAQLGMSEGAVRHRVARMVAEGTILRTTVVTRPLGPEGLVLVRCRPGATRQVVERMRHQVVDLFETSGEYDLGANVEAPTMEAFNRALDGIRAIRGVESTTTLVRLTRFMGSGDREDAEVERATVRRERPAVRGGSTEARAGARGSVPRGRRPPRSRTSAG
jgi:DNA-binding Lrp family transcriptional regulator